jgi:hypothetical protein
MSWNLPVTEVRRVKIATLGWLLGVLFASPAVTLATAPSSDAKFIARINVAMMKMMTAMNVKPSGDVDQDFVATMVPHHQGAIDMAQAELRYGRNQQLQRLAQEIIVTQQEEIAAMRLAVGRPLPPSVPAPDQTTNHPGSAR